MDDLKVSPKMIKGCGTALIIGVLVLVVWLGILPQFLKHTDPGYAGVVITYTTSGKPAIENVPTGNYIWLNPFSGQHFVEYPIAQQSLVMVKSGSEGEVSGDDSVLCQDKSGISINLDVTVLWQVDPSRVSTLYLLRPNDPLTGAFNADIESTVVRPVVRNAITEACASYNWNEVGAKKQGVIADAASIIIPHLASDGILVQSPNVFIGEVHYSDQQQQAINANAIAQQQALQAQYLKQKAQYEADAEVAKAQGDAQSIAIINKQLAQSPQYIQYLEVTKWDGHLPQYLSTNGSNTPIVAALGGH